jgi:hypothetical protein
MLLAALRREGEEEQKRMKEKRKLKKSKTIKQKDMKVKEHITYKGPREQSR